MDPFLLEAMGGCNEFSNTLEYNSELFFNFSAHEDTYNHSNDIDQGSCGGLDLQIPSLDPNFATDTLPAYTGATPDGFIDGTVAFEDFPDDCFKFISEILMEADLDDQTACVHDYSVLQATEKSLLEAIGETSPSSSSGENLSGHGHDIDGVNELFHQSRNMVSTTLYSDTLSHSSPDSFSEAAKGQGDSPASTLQDPVLTDEVSFDWFEEACKYAPNDGCNFNHLGDSGLINKEVKELSVLGSRGRKNLSRDDDHEEGRRNKHLAADDEDYVQMEQYDDVLLCKEDQDGNISCPCKDVSSDNGAQVHTKGSRKTRTRVKKKEKSVEQVVDLRNLLTQCAQAVGSFDMRSADELLTKIRIHSSQYGDSSQRLAHYFANGLEARLAGVGWLRYIEEVSKPLVASEVLQGYRVYVSAVPFRRTSHFVANDAIATLAEKATRIHIIDFGIFFGLQWPGLIQSLAKRKGGPPVLRITGIDYPERGFRPAKRVEATGRRLAGYCERFKVPFMYQAIAKSYEAVTVEELDIQSDELVVVNCLYMSRKLLDETVDENNPRDSFFRLIRKLNPDLFIHGIVNGIYNGPFFETRFREALFHYSSIYDMLETTIPRESKERLLCESHLYGADALNVIACEGIERTERPETYRQWQDRIQRAGFKKLVMNKELVNRVNEAVKEIYHKDFVIYENSNWMLQGWKGRILYAISCWTSA